MSLCGVKSLLGWVLVDGRWDTFHAWGFDSPDGQSFSSNSFLFSFAGFLTSLLDPKPPKTKKEDAEPTTRTRRSRTQTEPEPTPSSVATAPTPAEPSTRSRRWLDTKGKVSWRKVSTSSSSPMHPDKPGWKIVYCFLSVFSPRRRLCLAC